MMLCGILIGCCVPQAFGRSLERADGTHTDTPSIYSCTSYLTVGHITRGTVYVAVTDP